MRLPTERFYAPVDYSQLLKPDAPGDPLPRDFAPLAPVCVECGFHHVNGDHVYVRRLPKGVGGSDVIKREKGALLRERIRREANHAASRARVAMLRRKGV